MMKQTFDLNPNYTDILPENGECWLFSTDYSNGWLPVTNPDLAKLVHSVIISSDNFVSASVKYSLALGSIFSSRS